MDGHCKRCYHFSTCNRESGRSRCEDWCPLTKTGKYYYDDKYSNALYSLRDGIDDILHHYKKEDDFLRRVKELEPILKSIIYDYKRSTGVYWR
ncbi:unnamed protein product [marine sediment metagenome]|uniref:Uncharacterized protein n=1 Tax=marine sediment metagenome TaxID=412755 RepID=X1G607_9ZZZZ